jgi:hypothetical protein
MKFLALTLLFATSTPILADTFEVSLPVINSNGQKVEGKLSAVTKKWKSEGASFISLSKLKVSVPGEGLFGRTKSLKLDAGSQYYLCAALKHPYKNYAVLDARHTSSPVSVVMSEKGNYVRQPNTSLNSTELIYMVDSLTCTDDEKYIY